MKRYINASVKSLISEDYDTLLDLAEDPNTRPEILDELLTSDFEEVYRAVAKNPNTSPNTLHKIYEDHNVLDIELAQNPKLPYDLCELFSSSEYYVFVREALASNPGIPLSVMQKLANDEDWHVRTNLAQNPSLPDDLITKFAKDAESQVRKYVCLNPNISNELLLELCEDVRWYVREIANTILLERGVLKSDEKIYKSSNN